MQLAKPAIDIGLSTARIEPALHFFREDVGLTLDHVLAVSPAVRQHRFDAAGSVVKLNENPAAPSTGAPSGYDELIIARVGLAAELSLAAPDGAKVRLVPAGWRGVGQIAVRMKVRDVQAHTRFFSQALGLESTPADRGAAVRCGDSLIMLEPSSDAPADASMAGPGWRYITFQVFKVDIAHAHALSAGAREARAPITLGKTARISMIRDPDGNWIELSQRASIVGSLEA
ncbi:MAG TPA: VOC family protein [Caulobacteraceae bacterium]|jgi:lactoylglutathione lyase|nr:VOC family protein [Caulobacteraceae bacterium]